MVPDCAGCPLLQGLEHMALDSTRCAAAAEKLEVLPGVVQHSKPAAACAEVT